MKSRPTRRQLVAAVAAVATPLTAVAVTGPAAAAPSRHVLAHSRPGWTGHARKLGTAAAAGRVDFGLVLSMRDMSGATAALASLSDPSSASYGKWLTHSQFTARYAPASGDVRAVKAWLATQGFSVRSVLGGGLYVAASGTAAQVEKTFGTSLGTYSYKGKTVRANTGDLSLPTDTPAAVLNAVSGVLGVDQGATLKQPAALPGPPPGERYGVQPCSAYYGQKIATTLPAYKGSKRPYAVCGYGPSQLQSAYGESSLLAKGVTGRGITVAITDAYAAPTILKDAQKYSAVHHQPGFGPGQFRQILPSSFNVTNPADAQGWYGEETLDVEAVHAMAPGAKVVYVAGADNNAGLDEAWGSAIDHHVGDVITNSWSTGTDDINQLGQAAVDYYIQFSLEGALTGITDNFSTGDAGDETAGGTNLSAKSVGFPADLPFVTGVGGTSILIGKTGHRLAEYGWQNAYSSLTPSGKAWTAPVYSSGGGGGTSVLFAQPFYQRGVVPKSISTYFSKTPARTLPDISMVGDPNTGFLVGETQVFPDGTYWDQYRIGGTSLSSPLLAGAVAVAGQAAGHPLGFVNPLYYKLSGTNAIYDTKAPASPLTEVRTDYANFVDKSAGYLYRLQTIDSQVSTLKDRPGYDDETGLGAPNGPSFFTALAKLSNR